MKVGGKVYSRWNRGIYLYSSFIALWNKALKYLFHSSMLQKKKFWKKMGLHCHPVFSSVQSLSRVRLFATPWIAACQASLSITNSQSSLKLTSIESVMPSSHLILCRPLFLLPPIPPSIRVNSSHEVILCSHFNSMATHSSTLVWRIPWTEEPGGLQSMGSLRVGHDWVT